MCIQLTFFSIHFSACVFYGLARIHGLSARTWAGSDVALLQDATTFERYLISLYWSMTTFSTNGYIIVTRGFILEDLELVQIFDTIICVDLMHRPAQRNPDHVFTVCLFAREQ